MILTRDGKEITAVYRQDGSEVDEVKDANGRLIYTASREITGTLPLPFSGRGKPLTDYLISGNTIQNGTPTPEAPVEVVGCGVRTENLLNNDSIVEGGWLAAAGTEPEPLDNPRRCRYSDFFAVASKTILYDFKDLSVNIVMMDSNGLSLGGTGFLSGAGSITFLSNTEKISLIIANSDITDYITVNYARSKNISLDYGFKLTPTVNGTEYPIYLGQVETTRRIKKLVLTGKEDWGLNTTALSPFFYLALPDTSIIGTDVISTHFKSADVRQSTTETGIGLSGNTQIRVRPDDPTSYTLNSWKEWLSANKLTIWYVLAEQETAVVNEPLMKIGNYADTITMSQAGVTIPTINGANVLDMASTVKPSEVYIKGNIKTIT